MYRSKKDSRIIFSPSDLTTYWESEYASWMDRYNLENPGQVQKDPDDEMMKVLQEKGFAHEKNILEKMKSDGLSVKIIDDKADNQIEETIKALHEGHDVIFQGKLQDDYFMGYSDFLVKVDGHSKLGNYHYEVWDSKLATKLKPYFVIQLCAYSQMLSEIQGVWPKEIVVLLGNGDKRRLMIKDFIYYYKALRKRFLEFQDSFSPDDHYQPERSRSYGKWEGHAKEQIIASDSLMQVANISKNQAKNLAQVNITTMKGLAESQITSVPKISDHVFERLKKQAQTQLKSIGKETPYWEAKDHSLYAEQNKGLFLLPPPSKNDVYFDIEGYPIMDGGLEYLWGNSYFEGDKLAFKDFWAHNRKEEQKAFEDFVDWIMKRWQDDHQMHVYHYAQYELTVLKRLMSRYASREEEVDQLLRHGVFVDLYQLVKQGVWIGEPRYSIKNVEHIYRGKRNTDVASGSESVVFYNAWLEDRDGDTWQDSKILKDIRDYNIDDCESTYQLTEWLRGVQKQEGIEPRTDFYQDDDIVIKEQDHQELRQRLESLKDHHPEAETISYLIDFHQREDKPGWWEYFARKMMSQEELNTDLNTLVGLVNTGIDPEPIKRSLLHFYTFDKRQESKVKAGSQMEVLHAPKTQRVTIQSLDYSAGAASIKLGKNAEPDDLLNLVPSGPFSKANMKEAIVRFAEIWSKDPSVDNAVAKFIAKKPPQFKDAYTGSIVDHNSDIMGQIIQRCLSLKNSSLCIQGPPGAGKTYTASHIICELIKQGYTVGISSNSHKAINNLMSKAVEKVNKELGTKIYYKVDKTGGDDELYDDKSIKNIDKIDNIPERGYAIVGATAFGFAREAAQNIVDYLFIDEAGQVSIANLCTMALAAKNFIFMGDQMQLAQPTQGTHPGRSGDSILDYLLDGEAIIPEDMGVLLPVSYRMHPSICETVSNMVYESQLKPAKGTERLAIQNVSHPSIRQENGIVFIPVNHEGNSQASEEEVAVVREVYDALIGSRFVGKDAQDDRTITDDDILIVSPYNFQVTKIKDELGEDAKVGSVDKFQGQEAPVVIISMAASEGNSGRGADFLFSKNRMNVALSRAQALVILIANPNLGSTFTGNVENMALVNLFCKLTQ